MEFLDVVNEQDEVVGRASRDDIYSKLLFHRIVHILVFNKAGDLAVQKRALSLSFAPGAWCSTAAGHVESGESYEHSAQRELLEEAGIKSVLEFIAKDFFAAPTPNRPNKFLGIYQGRHEGPLNPNPSEVELMSFMSLDAVNEKLKQGEPFHPEFEFILRKHFNLG